MKFTRLHAITLTVGLLVTFSAVEQTEMNHIIIQGVLGLTAFFVGARPLFK